MRSRVQNAATVIGTAIALCVGLGACGSDAGVATPPLGASTAPVPANPVAVTADPNDTEPAVVEPVETEPIGADSDTDPADHDSGDNDSGGGDTTSFVMGVDGGSVSVGEGLPDGFPVELVPVVPGEVLAAYGVNTTEDAGFSVVITPAGPVTIDDAVDLLTATGFTVTGSMDAGPTSTRMLTSPLWEAVVSISDVEGDITVTYGLTAVNG